MSPIPQRTASTKQTDPKQYEAGEEGAQSILEDQQSPPGKAVDRDDSHQLAQTPTTETLVSPDALKLCSPFQ